MNPNSVGTSLITLWGLFIFQEWNNQFMPPDLPHKTAEFYYSLKVKWNLCDVFHSQRFFSNFNITILVAVFLGVFGLSNDIENFTHHNSIAVRIIFYITA